MKNAAESSERERCFESMPNIVFGVRTRCQTNSEIARLYKSQERHDYYPPRREIALRSLSSLRHVNIYGPESDRNLVLYTI